MRKGNLFVLSGPSGSGKTTLSKHIVKSKDNINFAISYTTRKKRNNEQEGVDYRYVTKEEFNKMVVNKEFAEWAEVYGNLYGTPLQEIKDALKTGNDILLDIDVQGARQIKNIFNDAIRIFIVSPSMDHLKDRLSSRRTETEVDLEKRLDTALREITQIGNYDYIIINENIEKSVKKLESIIDAERSKTKNMTHEVFDRFNLN